MDYQSPSFSSLGNETSNFKAGARALPKLHKPELGSANDAVYGYEMLYNYNWAVAVSVVAAAAALVIVIII